MPRNLPSFFAVLAAVAVCGALIAAFLLCGPRRDRPPVRERETGDETLIGLLAGRPAREDDR